MISNKRVAACAYRGRPVIFFCALTLIGIAHPALADGCLFEPLGEGRVAAVIDGRTFRLDDGREVRLAGIEEIGTEKANANDADALTALIFNRNVTLRGENDSPDRYGRQPAFVYVDQSEISVQGLLLKQGKVLVSPTVTEKACAASLMLAETAARQRDRESGIIQRR